MLKWYAIYRDDPQNEHYTEEHAPRDSVLKCFEEAKRFGMHNGRAVKGMWLIDTLAAQPKWTIAVHGAVPMDIAELHRVHLRSKKGPAEAGLSGLFLGPRPI